MSAPKNPPAFPHLNPNFDGNWDKEPQRDGMYLRDWFAGQVLPVAFETMMEIENTTGRDAITQTAIIMVGAARLSYQIADAMMDEREREK